MKIQRKKNVVIYMTQLCWHNLRKKKQRNKETGKKKGFKSLKDQKQKQNNESFMLKCEKIQADTIIPYWPIRITSIYIYPHHWIFHYIKLGLWD